MNEAELLQRAKSAIDAGDKATAQRLLVQLVRQNPESELGWLGLSAVVDDPDRKRLCLERVLEVNPGNKLAQRRLGVLRGTQSSDVSQVPRKLEQLSPPAGAQTQVETESDPAPDHATTDERPDRTGLTGSAQKPTMITGGGSAAPPRRRRARGVVSVSLILALVSLVGWLVYDVYRLEKRVRGVESELSTVRSRLSTAESELVLIGALARNANMYAHSHYSDARMKHQVADLENSLKTVLLLRGVTFAWKSDEFPEMSFDDGPQIGLIAQEVEQVYPELVHTHANGLKSVDYVSLIPVLIEALKEQQSAIDFQERTISGLVQRNADLDARLTALESPLGNANQYAPSPGHSDVTLCSLRK